MNHTALGALYSVDGGSRGLMLASQTCNPKVAGSRLRSGRDFR